MPGFSENPNGSFDEIGKGDNFTSSLNAALQRARSTLALDAEAVATARAKTEAARRKSHRLRVTNIRRWFLARTKLLAVVLDVDRAIRPEGMSLGMVDFVAHPCDLAAVQVQLAVLGRPSRAVLEIAVLDDMAQRARVVDAPRSIALPKLPSVPKVERHHYCAAVIAYVEAALPEHIGREDIVCRKCGLFIPAVGSAPIA